MNESSAYDAIRPRLQGLGLDPQRIENVLASGTPDISYTHGMIENKHLAHWPARSATPVDIGLRKEQKVWLYRRWLSGGLCWILLRVGAEHLLFSGFDAPALRDKVCRDEMYRLACWTLAASNWEELGHWLCGKEHLLRPPERARYLRLRNRIPIDRLAIELGVTREEIIKGERFPIPMTQELLNHWLS